MTIESPCTRVCVLDPGSGFCLGCGRSGSEIGGWSVASPAERRAVMAALPARLSALSSSKTPIPPARLPREG